MRMTWAALSFLLGILLLPLFKTLPPLKCLAVSILVIPLAKKFKPLVFIVLGFTFALMVAHLRLDWQLPHETEGQKITITGTIASIPVYSYHRYSFLFYYQKHLIKLSAPIKDLKVGDEWKFTVKLKRIHSTLNPGGFDYEAWAFSENIRAQGYVVPHSEMIKISSHWYHHPIARFRQYLQKRIETHLPESPTSCWIEALVIGERHNISEESWEVLRNTGTNHLMAIAGLHIGFLAAFTHSLVMFVWRRRENLMLLIPAQEAAAIGSLIMALIYSALAGFSIPTERACIMLAVFLMTSLMRRNISAWQSWSLALILVLLINPFDVLSDSFWLSFGSVALIIFCMSGRIGVANLWWKWGRIQWVIAVGLIPFSLWLFHQISLVGFIANSIAIPWVGFLILPFCLLGCVCTPLLILADKSLGILWKILTYLAHLSWGSWYMTMPNSWILLTACMGIILLLLPRGIPGKFLGFFWFLPLFFYHPTHPKPGEVWLNLLDVGQGLSSVIQTENHILVFDTGPPLSDIPSFLYTLGVHKLDTLVISHGDSDHIGGVKSVLEHFSINNIFSSVPEKVSPKATYCLQGTAWVWDKVQFSFLYPTKDQLGLDNDSSCVLSVRTGSQQILLTGDIEKKAEKELVENFPNQLASTILIAPHHGSKTSAQDDFLAAVKPNVVLYGVGYRNRYHFPNKTVVEKYTALGVKQLDTVNSGEIELKINPNRIYSLLEYRKKTQRFWY